MALRAQTDFPGNRFQKKHHGRRLALADIEFAQEVGMLPVPWLPTKHRKKYTPFARFTIYNRPLRSVLAFDLVLGSWYWVLST